jgi:GH24 family phage-related lysozyme (muramidase)
MSERKSLSWLPSLQMVALYKDPEGKTVTATGFTRPVSITAQHSQSHAKQLTDHSTASEVESLKRRICELESRLANGNHEKINLE